MILYDPSWNTDQGVHHCCESLGVETPGRKETDQDMKAFSWQYHPARTFYTELTEIKHQWWDPKDGELYLNRVKPEETLVEARSDSDVQIDRQIWV